MCCSKKKVAEKIYMYIETNKLKNDVYKLKNPISNTDGSLHLLDPCSFFLHTSIIYMWIDRCVFTDRSY